MRTNFLSILLFAAAGLGGLSTARGDATRTQTIPLRAGWNAVFLEVQPGASKPAEVFRNLPVDTVACFVPGRLEAQYLRSPGDAPWRDEGWAVWHAPSRPEAFLSNLYEIQASRALLILANADFDWTITGEARATVLDWHPNTCTFTGLPVDPAAPPTFAQFFAGSSAHERLRIFRLEGGTWKLVRNAATEKPRSGEAFWIQTDGASRHQGPLRVKLPASGELDFDLYGGGHSLEFVNESAAGPLRVKIEVVGGADALPLRQVTRDLAKQETTRAVLPAALELPSLSPGGRSALRLEPHRDAMTGGSGSTLLRITDGRGTQLYVPVLARRGITGTALANP